jgi:DNA-directed RNA polymerase subunit RPC12/RpoP
LVGSSAIQISNKDPLYANIRNYLDLEKLVAASSIDKKKATYNCNRCKTKVWGKPGLKLICGECGRPYMREESKNRTINLPKHINEVKKLR